MWNEVGNGFTRNYYSFMSCITQGILSFKQQGVISSSKEHYTPTRIKNKIRNKGMERMNRKEKTRCLSLTFFLKVS